MKQKNIYTVALILPVQAEYSGRIFDSAIEYAAETDHLYIKERFYYKSAEHGYEGDTDFDAAIVWLARDDDWVEKLIGSGVLVVNTSGEWANRGIPMVIYDYHLVDAMLEHLLQLQPEELAYAVSEYSPDAGEARLGDYFVRLAHDKGYDARILEMGNTTAELTDHEQELTPEAEERLAKLISNMNYPAAIACGNDYLGYHIARIARKLGIAIPDEISILCMFDYRIARCAKPQLSSIRLGEGIGYMAMSLIDRNLTRGDPIPATTMLAPPKIVCRESTGGGQAGLGYLSRARKIIHDEACEGLNVASVAKRVGVSPQALHVAFRRTFGYTPGELINRIRLQSAKHYLDSGNMRIADIAGLCGFNQQSTFGKFFKRETGMTPLGYRKRASE